jgi:hypothetical protein
MSSPFQQKFMAKNPIKGFTMEQLEKSTKKAEEQMIENAAILPQIEGPGNPDYESKDEQEFAGDDTYTYKKNPQKSKESVAQMTSPLNGAYESGAGASVYVSNAPAFSKLQNQINASTKEAISGLAKDKKDEEISDAFKSLSFKPADLSGKYKTDRTV